MIHSRCFRIKTCYQVEIMRLVQTSDNESLMNTYIYKTEEKSAAKLERALMWPEYWSHFELDERQDLLKNLSDSRVRR